MKAANLAALVALTTLGCLCLVTVNVAADQEALSANVRVRTMDLSKSVPGQINYQGFLANAFDSSAITATLEMTFRLFDSETKGAELWAETHPSVEVSYGLFQVLLGSMTTFPDGLFDGSYMWLQTEVGAEVLTPRKPLVSVAYSHRTNSAEMLENNTLTDLDDRWVNVADLDHLDAADGDPADAVYVDDDGKVGVGTTSPLTELDVNGSVSAATYYGDGSNLTGISGTPDTDWTIDGNNVYHQTGNVGIGTVSPSHPLDVSGAVNASTYYGDGSNLTGIAGTPDADWTIDGDNVYHETGKVGIGTTSPSHPLDVNGAVGATTYYGDGSNLTGISGTTDNDWTISGNDIYSSVSGNVGVGTSSPSARLDVSGEVNTDSRYKIDGNTVLSTEGTKTISVGIDAGANGPGDGCTFVGDRAGHENQNSWNTFIGASAGDSNTAGNSNTFVGASAGQKNTVANSNTFVGVGAGYENITGVENTFVGHWTGQRCTEGDHNAFVGAYAGLHTYTGSNNVFIGWEAGHGNSGSNNVFIGHKAGRNEEGSNKLIIANDADTSSVLLYGDFSSGNVGLGTMAPAERLHLHKPAGHLGMRIQSDAASYQYLNFGADKGYAFGRGPDNKFFLNAEQPLGTGVLRILTATETGNVGIGTSSPGYKLDVTGDINTTGEIRKNGTLYNHPDYVFEPDYEMMSLPQLRDFVTQNKHLPSMPSAEEVKDDGVKLFEHNRLMLEKLEEAYLYILALEERITQLEDSQK